MTKQNKENAVNDFVEMIERSWTFDRLTEDERERWVASVKFAVNAGAIVGTYVTRWAILQAMYNCFLQGVGYTSSLWREAKA